MILVSLLFLPILAAILVLFIKNKKLANWTAILFSALTLLLVLQTLGTPIADFDLAWLPNLNSRFVLHADGLSKLLLLLTAISFPAILISTAKNEYKQNNVFLSLLLFTQAGLIGVFLAADVLLFYFFWEAMLIPMYINIGVWGGQDRSYAAIKFFIYTFLGSTIWTIVLLIVGYQIGNNKEMLVHYIIYIKIGAIILVGLLAALYIWNHRRKKAK